MVGLIEGRGERGRPNEKTMSDYLTDSIQLRDQYSRT